MSLADTFFIENVRIQYTKPGDTPINRDFVLDRMRVRAIPVGRQDELIDDSIDRTFRGFRINFRISAEVWERVSGGARDFIDVVADCITQGTITNIFPDASKTDFSIVCEIVQSPLLIEDIRRGTRTQAGTVDFISKGLVNLTNFRKFKRVSS